MSEFFEYDPVTGITTYMDMEQDAKGREVVRLTRTQDISAIAEFAKRQRIEGVRDKGIKENWWHYAYIPAVVMAEMHSKGIDVMRDQKAVIQHINQHHPYLKTTEKWHDSPKAGRRS